MKIKSNYNLYENTEHKRRTILKYCELILKGESVHTIKNLIKEEFPTWDHNSIVHLLTECRETIAEVTAMNNEKVVQIHVEIYEDIYKRLMDIDSAKTAMMALYQKELLLGKHQEDKEIVVNNQTNVVVQTKYDYDKLSDQEQERLRILTEKMS